MACGCAILLGRDACEAKRPCAHLCNQAKKKQAPSFPTLALIGIAVFLTALIPLIMKPSTASKLTHAAEVRWTCAPQGPLSCLYPLLYA